MKTKAELLATIQQGREQWHTLLAEVGQGRMEQPGPMGEWTFKDLTGHIIGWRERTIRRLEAGPDREPPMPWPADLTEEDNLDEINAWMYARHRDRPLGDVLADAEDSYTRLEAAIAALPEADLTTPGRFAWADDTAVADLDYAGHLNEEHLPEIRAWLASQ